MRRSKQQSPADNEPLLPLLTVAQVCSIVHLSRPALNSLIAEGLPVIRFGKAIRFSPTSLKRWLVMREEVA